MLMTEMTPPPRSFPDLDENTAYRRNLITPIVGDTPEMAVSGYTTISPGGISTWTRTRGATAKAEMTKILGKHTLRAALDARYQFRTGGGGGNTSGNFAGWRIEMVPSCSASVSSYRKGVRPDCPRFPVFPVFIIHKECTEVLKGLSRSNGQAIP